MRSIPDSRGVALSRGARIDSAKNRDAKSFVSGNPISDPLMLLLRNSKMQLNQESSLRKSVMLRDLNPTTR